MAESPGSPLSELSSEDFPDDVKTEEHEHERDPVPEHAMPPSKRQRLSGPSWDARHPYSSSHRPRHDEHDENGAHGDEGDETETDISSDTSGDIPGSPSGVLSQLQDEEAYGHEQITVCRWDGCPKGDLGNMDNLVTHIHDDHIGTRQKKYACEWEDCSRKGMPHASGYALRAHMRSHTREKPFYCALPECDRSFTRSDALAKHMRTVHETEALRPSDPVPKHHGNPPNRSQRLKLILPARPPSDQPKAKHENHEEDVDDDATIVTTTDPDLEQNVSTYEYPPDVHFTEEELAMPPDQLYRLLRRQLYWNEEENRELRSEVEHLEAKRKQEWLAKELVLMNVMEAELACAETFGYAPDGLQKQLLDDFSKLPLTGGTPWYRKEGETEAVKAAK
ncbi:hypothetical protein L228DRAFT_239259 [Xylona heveae TC161]|uniref:C2H2-type domain-containing protein n=1 Tax=Xylona heveae (strain CBS 132557 / TC161) TaxID=1328760 RepID=A0A165GJM6_XYLHT|nr:hypothetical protein L228DRAFT_239259 [Xylona heveae TC161]KZF22271.1 hypothetical protein L228DRAFT_239259 [Xylona heveae TC161]